ncbi:MAG: type II secretion system F family protein [Oligoflexia bacterium]|nr:type II secretion system F family protein [Oligoflexia bacterium]
MSFYKYKSRNRQGLQVNAEIEASDINVAKNILAQNNLLVTKIEEIANSTKGEINKTGEFGLGVVRNFLQQSIFRAKVSAEEMLIFNRQLQLVYSVRISVLKGLQFIYDQTESIELKRVIKECMADISEGRELNYALSRHPHVFDKSYVSLIRAGELSGELDMILDRICEITEVRAENDAKIKGALFYPKIVIAFMSMTFLGVVYVILPKMKGFYANLNIELPGITKFCLAIADFFASPYVISTIVALFIIACTFYMTLLKIIKSIWSVWSIKLPYIGVLLIQIEMNSFCKILELLLKSGMTFTQGLDIVRDTATNHLVANDIYDCKVKVEGGKSIHDCFNETKTFPKIMVNMVSIGEETGNIGIVLNRMASYYKLQIEYRANNLSKAIEPMLLFLIFGAVTILALAIFMPMWKMTAAAKRG